MDADLDLLLTAVYVTADDLLPARPGNARRSVTDAEVVTLCVAQAIMGIPSDRRFLAVASKYLRHLFPSLPGQAGYCKRRRRLADTLEWLMGVFASQSPGYRRRPAARRLHARGVRQKPRDGQALAARPTPPATGTAPATAACSGVSGCMPCAAPDGTPRAIALTSPKLDEREVALKLLARAKREGAVTVIADKGYAGREFATKASELDATIVRPRRKDEPGQGPHLAPIRQRIESIFWTCKDILTLERHGARTLAGLRERILQRLLTLAAAITLNHQLGRPSRALVNYCA